jgi:hypothetical protein
MVRYIVAAPVRPHHVLYRHEIAEQELLRHGREQLGAGEIVARSGDRARDPDFIDLHDEPEFKRLLQPLHE